MLRKQIEDQNLEKEIAALLSDMTEQDRSTREYAHMADQLVKLYSLREKKKRVSPDTWAVVGGNLLGILAIVGHERANVITSKALSFVLKSR